MTERGAIADLAMARDLTRVWARTVTESQRRDLDDAARLIENVRSELQQAADRE